MAFALILRFRVVAAAVVFLNVEIAQIDKRVNAGSDVNRIAELAFEIVSFLLFLRVEFCALRLRDFKPKLL